jgi:outer membrane protein assembly factor BamA
MPMVNYDPALGWNFAALTNTFFKTSTTDTISPLSMAGAMVGMTTNKTWYWALYAKLYLDKDNYRISVAYGDASVNFQHYDEVNGSFIDFNSLNDLFLIEVQRRVYKRWYLGAKYVHRITTTTFEGVPDAQTLNMSNLGFLVSHDTRDFIYNPHTGDYMNFKTGYNREALGSDYHFSNYNFDYTKFFAMGDGKTIAARVTAMIATGEVPFEGQNVVGRDDIRGYTNGKHRANQTYNIQAEYRWNFYGKWGMVAFGGIATAANNGSEVFSELLPAVGTGIRFMAVPSEKINVGIDVATGIDDWGIYFRIGEVFGDK